MNSATVSLPPAKKVLAAGLFGAFLPPKPDMQPQVASDQDRDEFIDDFLAGTHAHPCNEPSPGKA